LGSTELRALLRFAAFLQLGFSVCVAFNVRRPAKYAINHKKRRAVASAPFHFAVIKKALL